MTEYISKEAVVRYLKGYSDKEFNSNSPYGMITSSVLNKVERALSEMPAADVQPVKHGRWITVQGKYGDSFLCSNCGTAEKTESGEDGAVWWHDEYCRKCGARMDGGEQE